MGAESPPERRYPRYHTNLEVVLYLPTGPFVSQITQISRGGCLVFPNAAAVTNTTIRMSFRLSEDTPPINCKGEIVYSFAEKGTGIAFTEISAYNQDLITSFFEKQLGAKENKSA